MGDLPDAMNVATALTLTRTGNEFHFRLLENMAGDSPDKFKGSSQRLRQWRGCRQHSG